MNCCYKRISKECVKQVYEDESSPYYQKPAEWCVGCKKIVDTSSNSDYAELKDALESIAECGGCLTGEDAQEMKQIAVEALQYSAKE